MLRKRNCSSVISKAKHMLMRMFVMVHNTGDQTVSVHLMITIQITLLSQHTSFLPHYLAQSDCLAADRQGQGGH
jgi:hypothetical protein